MSHAKLVKSVGHVSFLLVFIVNLVFVLKGALEFDSDFPTQVLNRQLIIIQATSKIIQFDKDETM